MKEYKIYNHKYNDRGNDIVEIEKELNFLSKEGWKVINFNITDNLSGYKYPFIVLLEREISPNL